MLLYASGGDMAVQRIHHLNCGTMCPVGGRLFYGAGPHHLVCHCLLVETDSGLVLVDTGFGLADVRGGSRDLGRIYTTVSRPGLAESECAVRQIEALGFSARDVRHIVVTHLDPDHAGGIPDFPEATVHVHGPEQRTALGSSQHRHRQSLFAAVKQWRTYDDAGEKWFGFDSVRTLEGLPPEILMIPLIGHSAGHVAIAVSCADGWRLHCGDAYFHRATVDSDAGRAPFGTRVFEWWIEHDRNQRLKNQTRLRALAEAHGDEVQLFCSHDAVEFEKWRA